MSYKLEVPPVWTNTFNCLFAAQTVQHEVIPEELEGIGSVVAAESRIAVFGGKSAGKSTYNKWLVNRLLELEKLAGNDDASVVFIDLDPGQAEFTPPGVISVSKITHPVHGPNSSHLCPPVMSKYVGAVSMADCPALYIQCVRELFEFINQEESFKNVPWVLNTMGFVKGLGLSLNCKVVCSFSPTVVIQIMMEEDSRPYSEAFLFDAPSVYNFMMINEQRYVTQTGGVPILNYQFISFDSVFGTILHKTINKRPKDLRDEVLIAYFAKVAAQTEDNNILAFPPRIVSLSSVAIGTMISALSYEGILNAMNGNLVALCKFPQDVFVSHSSNNSSGTNNRMIINGSRFSNEFYGYGIVRCIEKRRNQYTSLYITTPVSEEILKNHVNCLVTAGTIGLPIQIYLNGMGEDKASDFGPDHDPELSYIVSKRQLKSKLNEATKRQFVPKRVSHNALKNCLL